ncbi:CD83 antigen [Entelurus aequoreus]|uniref:CD83 antigen n=1 Tax=Entelurus aequoreus TaxID=161455 RepID=UPI002B1E8226|nr:CD83 antigen [Entelurus aequoreus]
MSNLRVYFMALTLGGLLGGTSAQGRHVQEVEVVTGGDYSLRCPAEAKPGVNYTSLQWYKLPGGAVEKYVDSEREVDLLDRTLSLHNVTCADAGVYACRLEAPAGERSRKGEVLLTLSDCSDRDWRQIWTDTQIIFASVVLLFALFVFLLAYGSFKTIHQDRKKTTRPKISLDAPLQPLDKKDLMLISTLGPPCSPRKSTMKHMCV